MHVTAVATISLDGRITPPGEEGTPFAAPATHEHFFGLLRANDVSVSGRRTFTVVRELMLGALQADDDLGLSLIWTRDPAAHAAAAIPGRLEFTDLAPHGIVADLEARGMERLLVAGGGEVYAAFAAADLVDEWVVVVEPVLLGGGTPLLADVVDQRLALRDHRSLDDDTVLLHYLTVRGTPVD